MLKTILYGCLTTIFSLQISNVSAQENKITLISSEGEHLSFPAYLKEISILMKKATQFPGDPNIDDPDEIPLPQISSKALKQLKRFVEILPQTARSIDGEQIGEEKIGNQTLFINKLIRNGLDTKGIRKISGSDLHELLRVACFLEIEPLTNGFAYVIAERTYSTSSRYIKNVHNLQLKFSNIHWNYIKKYLYLKQIQKIEYTVEDYIAENGQPQVKNNTLNLSKIDLTGLQGLDKIKFPEQIQTINLKGNSILSFGLNSHYKVFRPFTELRALSLANNRLQNLPKKLFKGLTQLQTLDLHKNHLRELPEGVFLGLDDLQGLNLSYNELEELPPTLFSKLGQLRQLDINHNHLKKISGAETFSDLTQLKKIKLDHNHLEKLTNGLFQGLTKLKEVDLSYNHFCTIRDDFSPSITEKRMRKALSLPENTLIFYPQGGWKNAYIDAYKHSDMFCFLIPFIVHRD